jgi:hypothetical protein
MFRSITAAAAFLALVGLVAPASASETVKASNAPAVAAKPAQQAQATTVPAARATTTPSVATPAAAGTAKPGDVKALKTEKDEKTKAPAAGIVTPTK